MPFPIVRTKITFTGVQGPQLEELLKDVEGLGLNVYMHSFRSISVISTPETWEKLGIHLEERPFKDETYYDSKSEVCIPEVLKKYPCLSIRFLPMGFNSKYRNFLD